MKLFVTEFQFVQPKDAALAAGIVVGVITGGADDGRIRRLTVVAVLERDVKLHPLAVRRGNLLVEVSDDDAINTARELAKVQGLLVGTSSGANVWAAKLMAEKYGKDKIIATVLPDRAERYFSTALI